MMRVKSVNSFARPKRQSGRPLRIRNIRPRKFRLAVTLTEWWELSHNERVSIDPDAFKANATVCHHCRNKFAADQMRYPIMTSVEEHPLG